MANPLTRPGVRTIDDANTLSALANPVRSRMLDALAVDGPSTASQLAERTGQAVGSASHHLKVLAAAALVEEAPELARDRRERWWRLASRSTRWSRAEFADDASAQTVATAAESLQLNRQFERARDWLADAEPASEWDTAAFATQYWLKLTPGQLRALSEELIDLLERWRDRDVDDAAGSSERESVLFFARGFPAQP